MLLATGCGSGGGGDGTGSFESISQISIGVSPRTIDSGENFFVSALVDDVFPDGIFIKFRYPSSMGYVTTKTRIKFDDNNWKPYTLKVNELTADESRYLVFQLFPEDILGVTTLMLEFRVEGTLATDDAEIEADVDVQFGSAFDVSNPEFTASDSVKVKVVE